MGAGHSVELNADVPSVTVAGERSIISGSLDDLNPAVTAEQVLLQMVDWFRWPVDSFMEPVLKSCTVTEHSGSDDFTVKVLVDGKKLDGWGMGKGDGTDRVRRWKRVTVDMAAKSLVALDYVSEPEMGAWETEASEEDPVAELHVQILSEPTRMEIWVEDKKSGKRIAEDSLVKGLHFFTDQIIGQIQADAQAKVAARVGPSIKDAGEESVLTDPMGDHVTFNGFFPKMVAGVRANFERLPNATFQDPSDSEFLVITKAEIDGEEQTSTTHVRHSAESGEMTVEFKDPDGKVRNTVWRKLHREPLVLEAWSVSQSGERSAGKAFARQVQQEANVAIAKASSWFG